MVKYEDFVANKTNITNNILQFIGFPQLTPYAQKYIHKHEILNDNNDVRESGNYY